MLTFYTYNQRRFFYIKNFATLKKIFFSFIQELMNRYFNNLQKYFLNEIINE